MMKNLILVAIIILFFNLGCGVQKNLVQNESEVYQIVNLQSRLLSEHRLYYKSYVVDKSMFSFPNKYFKCIFLNPKYELARKETDSITALNISEDRKRMLVKKVEERYLSDFVPNILPKEEIDGMKENLTSKSWRWDKDLVNSEMTKIKNYNSVRFSAPVLNTKGDYAIMFVKFDSSIEARVYKKEDGTWTYYCYYPLSISD
jgi:hypothetical protein